MPNAATRSSIQGCALTATPETMDIHQGDQVNLRSDLNTYQVIGVDGEHDRCWVRRWPLAPNGGSPVFEIALEQIVEIGG